MSFRARLLLVLLPAALVPLVLLAVLVRWEVTERLTAQYQAQVEASIAALRGDLADQQERAERALVQVARAVVDDNRFRLAAVNNQNRRYLIDYAGQALELTGLDMLHIQDADGRILSSGHFRNEYDRVAEHRLRLRAARSTQRQPTVLAEVQTADRPFYALVGIDSFQMGGAAFYVVGGRRVDSGFLHRLTHSPEVHVALVFPTDTLRAKPSDGSLNPWRSSYGKTDGRGLVEVAFMPLDDAGAQAARFEVLHSGASLRALLEQVDQWFWIVGSLTALLLVGLIVILSGHITKPLADLAYETGRLDLHRLGGSFALDRSDEIGLLAQTLRDLRTRLQASVRQLREAERRATTGEIARQVNHDIKNGLIPIRNVLRHLQQVAETEPAKLSGVFEQREQTLHTSLTYLQDLAANYARLSPNRQHQVCDVSDMLSQLASDLQRPNQPRMRLHLNRSAQVLADPVALRRIFENLITNALDSLEQPRASVSISTERVASTDEPPYLRIVVADEGKGLSEDEQCRIFDDFYTTKANGTGLGLSIVRRLLMDLGGSIRVESALGAGSRFIVDIPAQV